MNRYTTNLSASALTLCITTLLVTSAFAAERVPIVIDGKFDDWAKVETGVTDPPDDVIDTDGREKIMSL
ncbi:MAG: hypothetical protein R3C11_27545 [Planctomycetaceae bacterium]